MNTLDDEREKYRSGLRRKLVDMLLNDYKSKRERGELFYEGRWITPDEKLTFIEDIRREHKALLQDSIGLILLGFIAAFILIKLIETFFFPK